MITAQIKPSFIYLDANATTPLSTKVKEAMPSLIEQWGNPSSIHMASRGPKTILRETRRKLAEYLECSPLEIIFNSGASEGNNTVLKSVFAPFLQRYNIQNETNHNQNFQKNITSINLSHNSIDFKNELIISQVEHPSLMKTAEFLKSLGVVVHYIPISKKGELDLNFVKQKLNSKTALVSVMLANNETGTIFPVTEIVQMAKAYGALVHTDAVQAFGKINFSIKDLGVDYLTLSAHKFYALKGTGVLFVKKNSPYQNLIHGGGQERARRGGTENILGISALEIMLNELNQIDIQSIRLKKLRDHFENELLAQLPNVQITARESQRLANTSSLVIKGVDGETLLVSLDLKGFAVSTGAACSSGNPEPSPVLLALGLTRAEAQNSLRVSLCWSTTEDDLQKFLNCLIETVKYLRHLESETTKYESISSKST